jgi:hypothetical protein
MGVRGVELVVPKLRAISLGNETHLSATKYATIRLQYTNPGHVTRYAVDMENGTHWRANHTLGVPVFASPACWSRISFIAVPVTLNFKKRFGSRCLDLVDCGGGSICSAHRP